MPAVQLDALLGGVHRGAGAVRLRERRGDRGVGVTGGRGGGGVPGGGARLFEFGPDVGDPVLERLEPADLASELTAFLQVGDGGVQAPLRQPHLFGGEERGAQTERPLQRAGAVGDGDHAGVADGDVGELPGHVERDHRLDRRGVHRHQVQRHPVRPADRDQQGVRLESADDGPDRAGRGRDLVAGGGRGRDDECRGAGTARELAQQVLGLRRGGVVEQGRRGDHRARQERHRRHRAAELLEDDRRLGGGRAGAAELLRDQQAGDTELVGQRAPQVGDESTVTVVHGGDARGGAAAGEQVTHAVAQGVLDVGVQQGDVGGAHRGRSFQGRSLSVRGSGGSPSTRSAMMLWRISDVPPSIELPLARRYR